MQRLVGRVLEANLNLCSLIFRISFVDKDVEHTIVTSLNREECGILAVYLHGNTVVRIDDVLTGSLYHVLQIGGSTKVDAYNVEVEACAHLRQWALLLKYIEVCVLEVEVDGLVRVVQVESNATEAAVLSLISGHCAFFLYWLPVVIYVESIDESSVPSTWSTLCAGGDVCCLAGQYVECHAPFCSLFEHFSKLEVELC